MLPQALLEPLRSALAQDINNPAIQAELRRQTDYAASRMLGIDVTNQFVKPYWDSIYNDSMRSVMDFVGIAESDPPHSIDEAADMLKEQAAETVDSLADALRKRLAKKSIKTSTDVKE